jgi:parallel beta-helix repeat protein
MKKMNVGKCAGSKVIFGIVAGLVVLASSCKKEESLKPATVQVSAATAKVSGNGTLKVSQPISLNGAHDITISGYSITGGSASCIDLTNCYNIHITGCQLLNSDKAAINLAKCSNIIVDDCKVSGTVSGVYALDSRSIQVMNNSMSNITGQEKALAAFQNNDTNAADAASNVSSNNLLVQ